MSVSPATENLRSLLAGLYTQPGISGACLQMGGTVLVHDMPYSDDRVAHLAARITLLVDSYERVSRTIWQICAGYENFRMLILCHSRLRLTLLLHSEIDPALAAGRGMHLLMEVKSPDLTETVPTASSPDSTPAHHIPREDFEKLLSSLLARVTGSSQAGKLIHRELMARNINGSAHLESDEARRIGLAVLETIPNRGKRAALSSEFLNALSS